MTGTSWRGESGCPLNVANTSVFVKGDLEGLAFLDVPRKYIGVRNAAGIPRVFGEEVLWFACRGEYYITATTSDGDRGV